MSMSRVIVHLDAIEHNLRLLRQTLPPSVQIIAVVKANAYGHGAVQVARCALAHGAGQLAVANVEEGLFLRDAGIKAPILVLGGTLPEQADACIVHDLTQTVFYPEMLQALNVSAQYHHKLAKVHIKLETGMNRIGVSPGEPLEALLDTLQRLDHVQLTGVFSHLAVSDCDIDYTWQQYERFMDGRRQIDVRGYQPLYHLSNTAATLDPQYEKLELDAVRYGIGLYGLDPVLKGTYALRPAMEWTTRITWIHAIGKGESVGYAREFVAETPRRIATVPVGYADGYRRDFARCGFVLIGGHRAPIVGRVCMDQTMVDITDIAGVQLGDPVVLLGSQGSETITADDMAAWSGTIHYEIVTELGRRANFEYVNG